MAARDGRPLMWKDEDISAYGDLFRALNKLENAEEAAEFWKVYVAWLSQPEAELVGKTAEEVAASNIGYVMGYGGREDAVRVYELFGDHVRHPVFGRFA